jgi:hypothetical protein
MNIKLRATFVIAAALAVAAPAGALHQRGRRVARLDRADARDRQDGPKVVHRGGP